MAVALPAVSRYAKITPKYVDFGGILTPALGGPSQTVQRLGARFALDIQLPNMDQDCAAAWIAGRIKARTLAETLTLKWPQPAFATDLSGAVVHGAGQSGSSLVAWGLGAGKVVPQLSFFSFPANGRHYLHCTTDEVTADGSGHAALPIGPMLRASPADGAALEFANPLIEGLLGGTEDTWDIEMLRFWGLSFTLAENE